MEYVQKDTLVTGAVTAFLMTMVTMTMTMTTTTMVMKNAEKILVLMVAHAESLKGRLYAIVQLFTLEGIVRKE